MSEADTDDKPPETPEPDELLLDEEPGEESAEEEIEVEVGPKKFKLKKDEYGTTIKEAWDGMQTAHGKRSEELAAKAKAYEQQEKELQERQQTIQQFPKEIAKVVQLQEQVDSYQKVDWAQLRMSGETVSVNGKDVPLADYHWGLFQNAQAQLQAAGGDLKTKIDAEKAKRDGSIAQQKQSYHQEMASKVKDWSPQKDQELRDFAVKQYGVPRELADSVYHPGIMQIVASAQSYAKAMEKAKAAAAARAKQDGEEPLTPPKKIGTANAGRKPTLETAKTAEEYQKLRLKQMAENRAVQHFGRRH